MRPQKFLQTTLILTASLAFVPAAFAADMNVPVSSHISLWALLKAGGWTMIVLGALSVLSLTMVFYNFLTMKIEALAPMEFTETLIMRLESHDLEAARALCDKKKNIMTSIAMAGITRQARGRIVMREAMQKAMDKQVSKLWKSISYLGDIAGVAPLLGLFGTVVGMIQAFNVIAVAGASLKPIMLVGGISKALITTAAGLVIAIPTLGFYSYFKGTVQDIVDRVEDYATDIIKLIEESEGAVPEAALKIQTPVIASQQVPARHSTRDNIQEALSNA